MKPRSSARPLDVMLLGTLLAFGLVACGQQQEPAPAPPPAETAPPAAPAATEAPSLQERAMEAAESLSEQVEATAKAAADAVPGLTEAASEQAASLGAAATAQAQSLIEEVKTLIGEERMDRARALVDQLVNMRDSLSAELQEEVDRLQAMVSEE